MQRARIAPGDLSYINAHGTGPPASDLAETAAIQGALDNRAHNMPGSATKSMTGHLVGGAEALEATTCIQAPRTGIIPPTINLLTPDPTCGLDCVLDRARPAGLKIAQSNCFGFGRHNAALVFKAIEQTAWFCERRLWRPRDAAGVQGDFGLFWHL